MSLENYIINPLNGKPVREGGTVYRKLVKEGVLVHSYDRDPKVVSSWDGDCNLEELKRTLDLELEGEQCVLGRGIYKGFIVKKKKKGKHYKEPTSHKLRHVAHLLLEKKGAGKDKETLIEECVENTENHFAKKVKGVPKYYLEK